MSLDAPSIATPPARRLSRLTLHRRDAIGAAYHVLAFDAETPIAARAGQFTMVRGAAWGNAPLLPRPMSLLTGGERPSILIKVVGEGTRRMALAATGEPFDLLAPLGVPWKPCPAGRRPVLVAGGVGVAPLVFLAHELEGSGPKPLALYGGRTREDLPLSAELGALTELRVATEDGSRGTKGRVTRLLEEALDQLSADGAQVYTCGPDAMMAAVARLCEARGVPCEVSLETPMACGYGACYGCAVSLGGRLVRLCVEGPVVAGERLVTA